MSTPAAGGQPRLSVLVAGGTGRLGRMVVTQLLEHGHAVRVLARHPDAGADLRSRGADVVGADVRHPESLVEPVAGCDVVVSAVHGMDPAKEGSPDTVDRDGNANLVAASAREGASVVLMSVIGAAPNHPMELFRMKWAAEENLRYSGVPWTVVRASAFADLWAEILRQTARSSGRPTVFGRGDNPLNFVAVSDVAGAVVRAVEDASLRGEVIEVGGPENLTLNQLADRVLPGRHPRHVPRLALRAMGLAARPVRPGLARMARTGLAMDTTDQRFDPSASLTAYPWLSCTRVDPKLHSTGVET